MGIIPLCCTVYFGCFGIMLLEMSVCRFYKDTFFLWGIHMRMELLGHMVTLHLVIWGTGRVPPWLFHLSSHQQCRRIPFKTLHKQKHPQRWASLLSSSQQRLRQKGMCDFRRHPATRTGLQSWDCPPSFRKPGFQAKTVGLWEVMGQWTEKRICRYQASMEMEVSVLGMEISSKSLLFLV